MLNHICDSIQKHGAQHGFARGLGAREKESEGLCGILCADPADLGDKPEVTAVTPKVIENMKKN